MHVVELFHLRRRVSISGKAKSRDAISTTTQQCRHVHGGQGAIAHHDAAVDNYVAHVAGQRAKYERRLEEMQWLKVRAIEADHDRAGGGAGPEPPEPPTPGPHSAPPPPRP